MTHHGTTQGGREPMIQINIEDFAPLRKIIEESFPQKLFVGVDADMCIVRLIREMHRRGYIIPNRITPNPAPHDEGAGAGEGREIAAHLRSHADWLHNTYDFNYMGEKIEQLRCAASYIERAEGRPADGENVIRPVAPHAAAAAPFDVRVAQTSEVAQSRERTEGRAATDREVEQLFYDNGDNTSIDRILALLQQRIIRIVKGDPDQSTTTPIEARPEQVFSALSEPLCQHSEQFQFQLRNGGWIIVRRCIGAEG